MTDILITEEKYIALYQEYRQWVVRYRALYEEHSKWDASIPELPTEFTVFYNKTKELLGD